MVVEAGVKTMNHLLLRSQVEIDQHIAAENNVHTGHGRHGGILGKIQPGEPDLGFNFGHDLQLSAFEAEIFFAQRSFDIADAIFTIASRLSGGDRALIQIRGHHLERPPFQAGFALLQQDDGEGVGFFTGRAARAPDA